MNNEEKRINEIHDFDIYAIKRKDVKLAKAQKNRIKPKYEYEPIDGLPKETETLQKDYSYWLLCASVAKHDVFKMKDLYENYPMSEVYHLHTIILASTHEPPMNN